MAFTRAQKAKLNIVVSLLSQVVTLACGLIVPRMLMSAFGSEANGAVSSIIQFLGYITFLEGGIGGVARAALYKPLASRDNLEVCKVLNEVKHFFYIIGLVFAGYVLLLACSFTEISHIECYNWIETFWLVIILSISTFAQYFIGISNSILLQAAQKQYIVTNVNMISTILNTAATILLIRVGSSLHIVKLASSIVFVMKPIALWIYVKRDFRMPRAVGRNKDSLNQKWVGLGQHIAYVLHSHTDVAVLTVFKTLSYVSVYSVYSMVSSSLQNLTTSFAAGMEAVFGDMYAKNELKTLNKTFGYYDTLLSITTIVLFSSATALVIPFVRLYTSGITDAEYIQPAFAVLLLISCILFCLRQPYHSMVMAAGKFKETRVAAYGEAILNITISIAMVIPMGLVGVAIGTIVATAFRFIYYVVFVSKNILQKKVCEACKRFLLNFACYAINVFVCCQVIKHIYIPNYLIWIIAGACVFAFASVVTLAVYFIFYKNDIKYIAKSIVSKF